MVTVVVTRNYCLFVVMGLGEGNHSYFRWIVMSYFQN